MARIDITRAANIALKARLAGFFSYHDEFTPDLVIHLLSHSYCRILIEEGFFVKHYQMRIVEVLQVVHSGKTTGLTILTRDK